MLFQLVLKYPFKLSRNSVSDKHEHKIIVLKLLFADSYASTFGPLSNENTVVISKKLIHFLSSLNSLAEQPIYIHRNGRFSSTI